MLTSEKNCEKSFSVSSLFGFMYHIRKNVCGKFFILLHIHITQIQMHNSVRRKNEEKSFFHSWIFPTLFLVISQTKWVIYLFSYIRDEMWLCHRLYSTSLLCNRILYVYRNSLGIEKKIFIKKTASVNFIQATFTALLKIDTFSKDFSVFHDCEIDSLMFFNPSGYWVFIEKFMILLRWKFCRWRLKVFVIV